ncbi:MAG: DUF72 domain-containing protein [Actinomycetota bacterium]|nr:DUF72 domain-containing protein [Actinomycetota bacterium]
MPPSSRSRRSTPPTTPLPASSEPRSGHSGRIAVEFRSPAWTAEARDRKRTFALLEDLGLVFVCVDAPAVSGLPRLFALTNPKLLMVRFHGRSDRTWNDTSGSAAERFRYLYRQRELSALAGKVAKAAAQAAETHLLMNNCYRDYAVRNATQLRDLLARWGEVGTPPAG